MTKMIRVMDYSGNPVYVNPGYMAAVKISSYRTHLPEEDGGTRVEPCANMLFDGVRQKEPR